MAQITGFFSAKDARIEVSTDGTTWTDISGAANSVTPSGGGRMTGETYTFDGDNPIVTVGKSQPWDLTITAVYTEGATDVFMLLLPIWESGGDVWVRYAPKGGQTGEKMLTAGPGKLTAFNYPTISAQEGTPVMTGFTYHGPKPAVSTVA